MIKPTGLISTVAIRDVDEQRRKSPNRASPSAASGMWWRSYQRQWLSRDLLAGVTVAVVALGVLWGIIAASALSFADLLRRIARPHDAILAIYRARLECTMSAIARTGDSYLAW